MSREQRILVRTDAGAQIGSGHVMRCLALAQAWQDAGGQATFLSDTGAPGLRERVQSERIEIVPPSAQPGSLEDARATIALAQRLDAPWVVLDGYQFGSDFHRAIKDAGLHLLAVDDNSDVHHHVADLVLNQNLHAHEALYCHREPYTRLLLGTRYALLRREFKSWRDWQRQIPEVARKVLVSMGGGDPDNVTLKVIQALQLVQLEGLEARVLVGAANPNSEELQTAAFASRRAIQLFQSAANIPELMSWADAAVVGAGTTSWELAFLGLPGLLLVLAENQQPVAQRLGELGVAVDLGWHSETSPAQIAQSIDALLRSRSRREEMSRNASALVDGEGADRVSMHLQHRTLRLRLVREEDCKLLFEWANEPHTRAVSFSSDPIPWEDHVRWFSARVRNPNCLLYVAVDTDDVPVGQLRYDLQDDEAVVSIGLDKNFRGKGLGRNILLLGTQLLFRNSGARVIHAYIRKDNEASVRAFLAAGYQHAGTAPVRGIEGLHMVLRRGEGAA